MKHLIWLLALSFIALAPSTAYAGDNATLVFKSGQHVRIPNGYKKIVESMKRLNSKSQDHNIVELNIAGGSFLLNVAEVVIVCRDACQGMSVEDMRDPSRGGN